MSSKVRTGLTSQTSRLVKPSGGQAQTRWLDRTLACLLRNALGKGTNMDLATMLASLAVVEHSLRDESNSEEKGPDTWPDADSDEE